MIPMRSTDPAELRSVYYVLTGRFTARPIAVAPSSQTLYQRL